MGGGCLKPKFIQKDAIIHPEIKEDINSSKKLNINKQAEQQSKKETNKVKENIIKLNKSPNERKKKVINLEEVEGKKLINDNKKLNELQEKENLINNKNKLNINKIGEGESQQILEINIIKKEKDITKVKPQDKILENGNIKINSIELNNKTILENKANDFNHKEILSQKKLEKEKKKLMDKENELKLKEEQLKQLEKNLKIKELELIQREKDIFDKENKNKIVLIGLNNIGATCYMNATLQCLSNTKKLTEFFLNNYKKNPSQIMANEYYEVILNLWDINNNNKAYSPYSFKETLSKENPLFAGIQANDSKDLINFLIERFHQELNINNNNKNINIIANPDQTNEQMMLNSFLQEFKENFNSPISAYFYGILETKSKCQGCNIIKFNFQIYSFLEFPLQQVNQFFLIKEKGHYSLVMEKILTLIYMNV